MTKKNKIKKALPFVGLVACASIGTTIATTLPQQNQTTNVSSLTCASASAKTSGFVPGEHVSISGWYSGPMEDLSTINGQDIVNAINSFEDNDYNINGQDDALNFVYYKGEDAVSALRQYIQENVKYILNNDYTKVYDLPAEVISIRKINNYNLFNVLIDVSKINGKIVYFKSFNPSINVPQIAGMKPMNRQEVTWVQFNAISYTNVDMPILEKTTTIKPVNIIYVALGCVSGLFVILLLILWIRKRNAGKYIY